MVHVQVKRLSNNTNIKFIMLAQFVIAVVFLGVLEKARLGRWGTGDTPWQRRVVSRRSRGGMTVDMSHVDVIVALTHFAPPTLHTNVAILLQHSRGKSALIFRSTRKGAQEAAQCLSKTAVSWLLNKSIHEIDAAL